ncbi:MAG: hypothetical protein ABR992_06035 [Solirubrobacteraceae bacterium]|jgi:hypothetical protein
MNEREQIRQVCRWNQDLSHENQKLRHAVRESQKDAAQAGIERDTALILLESAWKAASEGQRQ